MTEEVEDRPKITFDGEEYIYADLPDLAKYYVGQLQTLNKEITASQSATHRLELSREGFINLLRLEINKESEEITPMPELDVEEAAKDE